jgi:hypothetical protein
MAMRVCDKCGKKEETRYSIIRCSRNRRGEETDYCYQCAQTGRSLPKGIDCKKWKHGKTHNGYKRITINGKRCLEHVHFMQESIGRQLEKGETVHHIDMDKTNNNLMNLYLFSSQSDHQKCHTSMERCGFGLLNKLIWFDYTKKEYVLHFVQNNNDVVEVPDVKKFQIKTGNGSFYWFYSHKNEFGKFSSRGYHLLIIETILNRKLFQDEIVHHIDGDGLNNDVSNLCVMTRREHSGLCHCSLQKCIALLLKQGVVGFYNGIYFLRNERVLDHEPKSYSRMSCDLWV